MLEHLQPLPGFTCVLPETKAPASAARNARYSGSSKSASPVWNGDGRSATAACLPPRDGLEAHAQHDIATAMSASLDLCGTSAGDRRVGISTHEIATAMSAPLEPSRSLLEYLIGPLENAIDRLRNASDARDRALQGADQVATLAKSFLQHHDLLFGHLSDHLPSLLHGTVLSQNIDVQANAEEGFQDNESEMSSYTVSSNKVSNADEKAYDGNDIQAATSQSIYDQSEAGRVSNVKLASSPNQGSSSGQKSKEDRTGTDHSGKDGEWEQGLSDNVTRQIVDSGKRAGVCNPCVDADTAPADSVNASKSASDTCGPCTLTGPPGTGNSNTFGEVLFPPPTTAQSGDHIAGHQGDRNAESCAPYGNNTGGEAFLLEQHTEPLNRPGNDVGSNDALEVPSKADMGTKNGVTIDCTMPLLRSSLCTL
jgi:hypothetical protein